MERFILDTNLFFNMQAGLDLGKKTEDVILTMTDLMKKLKNNKKAEFFMPPSIVSEFLSFFEDKEQESIKNLISLIDVKSPQKKSVSFSSEIFYKLVEDIRLRSYKGLNIAEEEIDRAGQEMLGQGKLEKKDYQIKIGKIVRDFRERYRNATRTGFLDSVADLDLIVLALEKDAFLVSTDEGVLSWGRTFGVKEMPSSVFRKRLEALL